MSAAAVTFTPGQGIEIIPGDLPSQARIISRCRLTGGHKTRLVKMVETYLKSNLAFETPFSTPGLMYCHFPAVLSSFDHLSHFANKLFITIWVLLRHCSFCIYAVGQTRGADWRGVDMSTRVREKWHHCYRPYRNVRFLTDKFF